MQRKVPISVRVADPELLPTYATEAASGADLRAAIVEPLAIAPGASLIVPTGVFVDIPEGCEIQVRPRSGFAAKNQVTVLNTPGTIDADYRGEISILLINHGTSAFVVSPKMRIAQLVLAPVIQAHFIRKAELETTERGSGRFGHTGSN